MTIKFRFVLQTSYLTDYVCDFIIHVKSIEKLNVVRGSDFIVYCFITSIIIIFDQFLKQVVEKKIIYNQKREVLKGKIYITNIRNKGAAYGLLKDSPAILFALTIFTLIIVLYNFIKALSNDSSRALKLGLAFILGGGIGNVIDRSVKKYVTDYIYIKGNDFPVFNLADLFVLLGTVILYARLVFED